MEKSGKWYIMTKLYVPLMANCVTEKNRNTYLDYLHKIKTNVVMLAIDRETLFMTREERKTCFVKIAEDSRFFQENGMEVVVWTDSYGFGGPIPEKYRHVMEGEPRITSVQGKTLDGALCPEGEKLVRLCKERIQDIARIIKPNRIMLDDEMCMSVRPGIGCFCEKHMALYEKEFGEKHTLEELQELIFTGYHEKYRRGWLKVVGDSMRSFCKSMRQALDEVNETIRLGFCAGYTSWDIEGVDALELTKILAGKTEPFLRFTGAAYWVQSAKNRFDKQQMNEVIETVRMQAFWIRESGVEVFHEDDTFPRPRYCTSANISECYDVPLRAAGGVGSFKYLFCYDIEPEKELGYVKKHIRNMPLYDFIEKHFEDKRTLGVQVHEEMHKMKERVLPEEFIGEKPIMRKVFPKAATFLTAHGIPTTYDENREVAIAFGDNARYVKSFAKKMLVDLQAAEILQEQGINLGLERKVVMTTPVKEEYVNGSTWILNNASAKQYYACTLGEEARVESYYIDSNGNKTPSSWRITYEGTEYLVFAFEPHEETGDSTILLAYDRKNQLQKFIENQYPYIEDVYGIYQIYKEGQKERAILFQNISEDEVVDGVIVLGEKYESMELFGADGILIEDKIYLNSIIQPFAAVAVVLKKGKEQEK